MGLLTLSGGRCQCFPLLPSSATAITISQRCGEELITHSLTVELTASSRGLGGSRDANGAYVHCRDCYSNSYSRTGTIKYSCTVRVELSISMKMISSTIHLDPPPASSGRRRPPRRFLRPAREWQARRAARCCGATDARERRSCT